MEKTRTRYGIIEPSNFPVAMLLMVPHRDGDLTVSYPAFGINLFKNNVREMQKAYIHPLSGQVLSFKEPTTSKSISAAAYGFGSKEEVDAKRILDDRKWLQLGPIVKTSEGIFTNIDTTDEKILKLIRNSEEKVNGICFVNEAAFVPYETFKQGVQEYGDFAESGLARALEHTNGKVATNLKEIASPKFYKRGVNVQGFDSVKKPVLGVAGLISSGFGNNKLKVGGCRWGGYTFGGYAFGILK